MSSLSEDDIERNPSEVSDSDSDLEELQGDIAKFDESVREFLVSHYGGEASRTRGGPRGRGARGPRKAAKPRGDITARLSKVNQAFLAGNYSRALDLAFEVIRINAETHQAWTAVASIFREQGELDRALSAMVYAAHLRPKDVGGWLGCASFALDVNDRGGGDGDNLHTARLCYSAALRADPSNFEARLGKANVCHQQGHLAAAITDYKLVLKQQPYNLDLVRKLAEACVETRHAASAVPTAIDSYRRYFVHEVSSNKHNPPTRYWHDIGIYVELFASTGRYTEGIKELKSLARWLAGRATEQFWEDWQDDDREWDENDDRRELVPGFLANRAVPQSYGNSLPLDMRARLAIYRLRTHNRAEGIGHLSWLDAKNPRTQEFISDFPFLAQDIAFELAHCREYTEAVQFFELLRQALGTLEAPVSVELGRCYLALEENAAAEECFLDAIDTDGYSVEARIELANMYENAREDEEALILAAEAMALREAHSDGPQRRNMRRLAFSDLGLEPDENSYEDNGSGRSRRNRAREILEDPTIPRRYRPKRLAGPARRLQDEQARAVKLSHQYEVVRDLKKQIKLGHHDLIEAWMKSSKELVDDFRSLKKFYSWDKYLHFLGSSDALHHADGSMASSELSQMYERLVKSMAPRPQQQEQGRQSTIVSPDTHQGISLDRWLELFLDYAIGLAMQHRRNEAYRVCEAARDSIVFQSPEHNFAIHVTWSVCAIYASDEETCVSVARHLMRDGVMSDSYRIFALLANLCQSPISWYTSGPAQKYILRQIKAMDSSCQRMAEGRSVDDTMYTSEAAKAVGGSDLDICLLMLYGHILFTSTSYTYALGYFLRARSADPQNAMVHLSLGLAYVHYALKRQSSNRQYLLLQGQAFMSYYIEDSQLYRQNAMSEVLYNVGRLFQLLGLNHLAYEYYSKAYKESHDDIGQADITLLTSLNSCIGLQLVRNQALALSLIKRRLVL